MVEVARTETLEVHAVVAAADAGRLSAGQKARVTVGALGRKWAGEVLAVSPLLDASTGTATVRIRLANPDGQLKGGEMAEAHIVLATHPDALAIPLEALLPENTGGPPAPGARPRRSRWRRWTTRAAQRRGA